MMEKGLFFESSTMSIFLCQNYQEVINYLVERESPHMSFQQIASLLQINASYLSKVMNKKANLNTDQIYLIAKAFKLSVDESHFFNLLLEYDRSGLSERRDVLLKEIEAIQKNKINPSEYLKRWTKELEEKHSIEYHQDPWNQIIHVSLSIAKYAKNPLKMCQDFSISKNKVEEVLQFLTEKEMIATDDKGAIKILKKGFHLSFNHPFFPSWIKLIRLNQLHFMDQLKEEHLHFAVTFSASKEVMKKLKIKLLEVIMETKLDVETASPEEVYKLGIDLFSLTE